MTIWINASSLVVQADSSDPANPVNITGCVTHVLTEAQLTAFNQAQATPNVGITFDGTAFGTLPAPPPPPPPPNANEALISKLQGLTLTAGGEGDQIRNAVI